MDHFGSSKDVLLPIFAPGQGTDCAGGKAEDVFFAVADEPPVVDSSRR